MVEKAKESRQVRRAREKLKRKILQEDAKINERAIVEIKKAIHHRFNRLSDERIPLKNKTFQILGEKQHSARTKSKYVHHLLSELKKEEETSEAFRKLIGRIKQ